ncbi:MAG TPA: cyclic nucleotide-binding domain-containing protein [Terriglobales bacterium]
MPSFPGWVWEERSCNLLPGKSGRRGVLHSNGTSEAHRRSKQRKEATVALLKEGDFVGEGCITSDQSLRTTSALAITDSSALRIEKKVMLDVLHREHAFSDLLVAFLVVRNSQIQADLVDQLFNSAETASPGSFAADSFWQRKQIGTRAPKDKP